LKKRFWLKAIALWQISGGVIGGVVLLDAIPRLQASPDLKWMFAAISIPTCLLSIVSGTALLKERRSARGPSIVVHSLQLLGVGSPAITYRVILGPYFYLYVTGTTVGVNTGFAPQLHLHWGGAMPFPSHVLVNLLSLTCLVLLIHWRYIVELVPEPPPFVDPPPQTPDPATQTGWPPINWP
jgi:hypothetical protein